MKNLKPILIALFLLVASGNSTPLLVRTGAVTKPFRVLGWVTFTYYQNNRLYDWDSRTFQPLERQQDVLTADLLASLGLPFNFELGGVLPLLYKKSGENHAQGVGDLMLVGRYGFLDLPLVPVKGALSLALNLPTGDRNARPPLGDGSTDFAAALALNTAKLGFVVAHLRLAYWLNGKTDDTTKLGNLTEYMAGLDLPVFPKLTPQFALTGYTQDQKIVNGEPVEKTEVSRNLFTLLFLYQPFPKLTIRPKLSFPLKGLSQGGAIADYALGLDLWTTLP